MRPKVGVVELRCEPLLREGGVLLGRPEAPARREYLPCSSEAPEWAKLVVALLLGARWESPACAEFISLSAWATAASAAAPLIVETFSLPLLLLSGPGRVGGLAAAARRRTQLLSDQTAAVALTWRRTLAIQVCQCIKARRRMEIMLKSGLGGGI